MNAAHMQLLPSGSMSNEALHAEINAWFRTTQQMHQATLALKPTILSIGKLMQHNSALYRPTSRQLSAGIVLARATSVNQWMTKDWNEWCRQLKQGRTTQKANLPLTVQKQWEEKTVQQWKNKKTHKTKQKHNQSPRVLKRTVFSLTRVRKLVRGGVKQLLHKRPAMR